MSSSSTLFIFTLYLFHFQPSLSSPPFISGINTWGYSSLNNTVLGIYLTRNIPTTNKNKSLLSSSSSATTPCTNFHLQAPEFINGYLITYSKHPLAPSKHTLSTLGFHTSNNRWFVCPPLPLRPNSGINTLTWKHHMLTDIVINNTYTPRRTATKVTATLGGVLVDDSHWASISLCFATAEDWKETDSSSVWGRVGGYWKYGVVGFLGLILVFLCIFCCPAKERKRTKNQEFKENLIAKRDSLNRDVNDPLSLFFIRPKVDNMCWINDL